MWHVVAIIISASCAVRGGVKPLNPCQCHSKLHATRSVSLGKLLLSHTHTHTCSHTWTYLYILYSYLHKCINKAQVGTVADVILMPVSPSSSSLSLFSLLLWLVCLSVCLFMLLTYLPLPAYQAAYVCHVPGTATGSGSGSGIGSKSET